MAHAHVRQWWGKARWRRPRDIACSECGAAVRLTRHDPAPQWRCTECGARFVMVGLARPERAALATWRGTDVQLRAIAGEPVTLADAGRRLGVHPRTVKRHVARAGSGLHVYDGRVYTGTAQEWGHYA